MGKASKEGKSIDIWKRKKWYSLIAPKTFKEAFLGETPALESKMVMGREAQLCLMAVTGDMKKKNISVSVVVQKVTGEKAFTELRSYELVPAHLKRMVRRGRDRLDEVYTMQTLDKVKVRIKPLIITIANTKSSIMARLRRVAVEEVRKRVEGSNYSELVISIISNRMQHDIAVVLKKIYPVRNFEIRKLEVASFDERTEEVQLKADVEVRKETPKTEPESADESDDEEVVSEA
jgi:small subunit ribosomal protein S3Ae